MKGNKDRTDDGPAGSRPQQGWPVRMRGFAALVAVLGFGLSACGGGAASPDIASVGSSSTTTSVAAAGSASSAGLAYPRCMRSHGVPNFPDPSANGGFTLGPGTNPHSPAFKAAQAKCQKLGGLPSPGSETHPSAQALAQILKISQCMRRHGISDFPDPTTSMPSNMASFQYVSDRDGAILAFPRGFDDQSPRFTHAAAACGFKLTNH